MRRQLGISDTDLSKLERARESLALVQALAQETNHIGVYEPQMLASFLDLICEDLSSVIQSAVGESPASK